MATKGPEHKVKEIIKQQLKSLGDECWFYMPVAGPYAVAGIPDFIGCYRGMMFGIEAKADGGRTTKWQERQIAGINQALGYGVVIKGVEQAAWVARYVEAAWNDWAGE